MMYTRQTKANHADPGAVNATRSSLSLQDNRPRSPVQRQLCHAATTGEILQRKISFAMGSQSTFKDIPHLKESLKKLYAAAHHSDIENLVEENDAASWSKGAVSVYKEIKARARKERWTQVSIALPSAGHGPSMPVMNASGAAENKAAAASAFMYNGITVAVAQLILPNKKLVRFEAKQNTAEGHHAEAVLIKMIDAHLASAKVDPARCRLRITINNAPCGTGKGEKNCAGMLKDYSAKFNGFRIYYMNSYRNNMSVSVKAMQSAGIKVSAFAPKDLGLNRRDYLEDTWAKIEKHDTVVPSGVILDQWSDSDSDSDTEMEEKQGPKGSGAAAPTAAGSSSSDKPASQGWSSRRSRSREPKNRIRFGPASVSKKSRKNSSSRDRSRSRSGPRRMIDRSNDSSPSSD